MKRIILSGIQPTGVPHLGNYLGAIRNWVKLQNESQTLKRDSPAIENYRGETIGQMMVLKEQETQILLSVVDLHAITMPQEPKVLKRNILEMGMSLLACGIDPSKSILFRQSKIHQHSELAWILFCKTPVSWLSRMHQWKTKSGVEGATNEEENHGGHIGLLSYPVLQAADILLYNTTHVPVGEDQSQHINLTTTIAKSFNSHHKRRLFTIPSGLYPSDGSRRIMSLKNPSKKMSKSDPVDQSRINLMDTRDEIRSKIKKATTDSVSGISYTPSRPGIANLLHILMSIQDINLPIEKQDQAWANLSTPALSQKVHEEFGHLNNSAFKELVSDTLIEHFDPIRNRFLHYQRDPSLVLAAFEAGESKASEIAGNTLKKVYDTVGL